MKFISRLLSLLGLTILITSCINGNLNSNNIEQRMESSFQGYYGNSGYNAGFKRMQGDNMLYQTIWAIKLFKLSSGGKSPEYSFEIISNLKKTNIFSDKEWLQGMPLDLGILYYVEIFNELNIAIPQHTKNEIESYIYTNISKKISSKDSSGIVWNGLTLIRLQSQINMETFNSMMSILKEQQSIYYYYFQAQVNNSLNTNEISEIKKFNVFKENQSQILNYISIENLYYLYEINILVKLDFQVVQPYENQISELLKSLFEFSNNIDSKIFTFILIINENNLTEKNKQDLQTFLNGTKLLYGWGNSKNTFSLLETYYGIEIAKHNQLIKEIKSKELLRFLDSKRREINSEALSLNNILELNLLIKIYIELDVTESLNEINNSLKYKLNALDNNLINQLTLASLGESILQLKQSGLLLEFPTGYKDSVENVIKMLETKNEKSIEEVYQLFIIKKLFEQKDNLINVHRMFLEFKTDEGFCMYKAGVPSIEAYNVYLKFLKYSEIDVDKEITGYYQIMNNDDKKNDFYKSGLISVGLSLIDRTSY